MEANGTTQYRLKELERRAQVTEDGHARQRHDIANLQAENKLIAQVGVDLSKDFSEFKGEMRGEIRSFRRGLWIAASLLGTLSVSILTLIFQRIG